MPYANYEDQLAHSKVRYERDKQYHKEKAARWVAQNGMRKKWLDKRASSKRRGVEFNLTYEEFVEFWGDDAHRIGRKYDDLCMGRYDDTGPYEVGNIYKCTNRENKAGPKTKPEEVHPDIPY